MIGAGARSADWVTEVVLEAFNEREIPNDPSLYPLGNKLLDRLPKIHAQRVAAWSHDQTFRGKPRYYLDAFGMIYHDADAPISFVGDFWHLPYRSWPPRLARSLIHQLITDVRKGLGKAQGNEVLAVPGADPRHSFFDKVARLEFRAPTQKDLSEWTCALRCISNWSARNGNVPYAGVHVYDDNCTAALRDRLKAACAPRLIDLHYGPITRPSMLILDVPLLNDPSRIDTLIQA